MAFGGLWESFGWPDETVTRGSPVMTTAPNAEMSELHYRIPATGSREATRPLGDFRHFVYTAESI